MSKKNCSCRITLRSISKTDSSDSNSSMRSDNVKRKPVLLQQSTPPAGEETQGGSHSEPHHDISIHSSRTGGDSAEGCGPASCAYFNPLLPHGRRPERSASTAEKYTFQSTPPAREETIRIGLRIREIGDFNPLLPHGRRRQTLPGSCRAAPISIHSSRTGGDSCPPPWGGDS